MSVRPIRRSKPAWQCEVDGCNKEQYTIGLCRGCYSYEYRWTVQKTPAERREHQKKLELYRARLDRVSAATRPRRIK